MHARRVALVGVLLGAAFWGLSGTASQDLFQTYHFPVLGLSSIRLVVGGLLLLAFVRPSLPKSGDMRLLVSIAIFGFVGTQISYLLAIQNSNAATATLLQFLFLPIVAVYEALTGTLPWSKRWTATLILAFVGTFLLIGVFSGGAFHLVITPLGLAGGLGAAITGAYYSLASRPLVKEKGGWWLTTWGFLIGGLVTLPLGYVGFQGYSLSLSAGPQFGMVVGLVSFVVIFGTILAFGLYVAGLKHLPATETGVAASFEPIVASIASYVFLGVRLDPIQYLGGALILVAVVLIAARPAADSSKILEGQSGAEKEPVS
jgi:drug/metabolite transporter (DMT)-like permease